MATVLPGPPSSGGGTIRSAARSGSLPPRPSSGGAAFVAALASNSEVDPSSRSERRDRLWLPHSAKGPAPAVSREPPTQAAGSTGALTGRLSHRDTATKVAETPVTGDTLRLEDPMECAPTPAVGSTAVPGRSATPCHAATVPTPNVRPLSSRSDGSARVGRQRPASANSRLHGRLGGRGEDTVPAAGKRVGEPASESQPPRSPPKSPNGVEPVHDWGAQLYGEGMGWKLKTLAAEEHFRHDPILHRIDVYSRDASGGVGARETAKGDYAANVRKAALAPRSPGRRKGVAEFGDLCALNAQHWDPSHEAALEQNRLAFHRRDGEFMEMYNNAARYPNKPRPFEPNRYLKPAGVGAGFGCARLPPKRVSEQAVFPQAGSRTRRPHTAGKRSSTAPAHQISAAPLVSVPLAA